MSTMPVMCKWDKQINFIKHNEIFAFIYFLKSTCFFWNNSRPNDKVKRSGSVDSLIDAQHNSTRNETNLVSIGPYFETNAMDNAVVNKRDKITRLKDQLAINAIPSAHIFQSQRNLQDIPLSPTSSQRFSKPFPGK